MKRYQVRIGEKSFSVGVVSRAGTSVTLEVEGRTYEIDVAPELGVPRIDAAALPPEGLPLARATPRPAAAGAAANAVVAPMPGVVVTVSVTPGDQVAVGQTVAVIEAMKMENNITCTRTGRVVAVHVKAGDQVEHHQSLVTFE